MLRLFFASVITSTTLASDEAVSLLQVGSTKKHKHQVEVNSSQWPVGSVEDIVAKAPPYQFKEWTPGIPAGCMPKLIAANKRCHNHEGKGPTYTKGIAGVPRVNFGDDKSSGCGSGKFNGIEGEMGWTNKGNGKAYIVDRKFDNVGIQGAWAMVNRADCCNTRFEIYEYSYKEWGVRCVPPETNAGSNVHKLYAQHGDHCDVLVDAPGYYVFDGGTESCGVPELSFEKNPGKCTIREWAAKEGCEPKLVKENYECSTMASGYWKFGAFGPQRRQGRRSLGAASTPAECVRLWAHDPFCCGTRVDWDSRQKSCSCADYNGQFNWWCQDDRIEPNDETFWGTNANEVHSNVYDIGHCVNKFLHVCPVDRAAYKGDPCKTLLSASLETLEYSNLGDQGPDSGEEGMLFTDVASLDGESIDLKVLGPGFRSVNTAGNGLSNGIGTLNIRCGTSADVSFKLINKDGEPAMVDGLAVTFLDMDEGKKGKSRTTVTSCGADHLHAGSELTTSEDEGGAKDEICLSASSAKHGSAANNPDSVDGITEDQKSRAATFMFAAGSEFNFTVAVSKGPKGRNIAFALSPVNGCD